MAPDIWFDPTAGQTAPQRIKELCEGTSFKQKVKLTLTETNGTLPPATYQGGAYLKRGNAANLVSD